jgi:hypothetical protein
MGMVLDKSELVHDESLQEMGGGWESKLPSDRGD